MSSTDIEYFRERAAAERALAAAATEPRAVTAHLDLARGYDALVRKEEARQERRSAATAKRPSAETPPPASPEQREQSA